MSDGTDAVARGAWAGMAGTAMMTLMMKGVGPKVMPRDMRPSEFAPQRFVEWAEREAGEPNALSGTGTKIAAYGTHFAYGSGSGAVYGLLREQRGGLPAPLAGMLFGIGLWAFSFEGWMPALGVREATTEKPPKKWPAPIMGHLVYGVTTALAYEALEKAF